MPIKIHPDAITALKNFTLPDKVGFGSTISPIMMNCEYQDGKWGNLEMIPYGPITLSPTCKVFHYAQEIFEGLKAYRVNNKGPFLFRHIDFMSLSRANGALLSLERICMHPNA